ncbi:S1 family peptidase [Rhodovulum steppense]|uniref:Trypsin-like peptidase n=1 Tax=Rhodovulum steppense TaxID=540251 RepID=A0A4V2R4K1_9RHOB|nr:serine protease [Rhodovulum steppense]TCM85044.1 trypsin-like peptidase [Rhodovulum steppense]
MIGRGLVLAALAVVGVAGALRADPVADTVVYIECTDPEGRKRVGSGVLVSAEGHVLTARHVAPAGSQCRGLPGVADPNNARVMVLQPERVPGEYDVALLKFAETQVYPFLRYCRLDERMIRKRIFAAGFPNGTRSFRPSFRAGILSTTETTPEGVIETDSLLAQGMSGGPILAEDETSLIGIVSGVEISAIGEPDYYGMTPIAAITSATFRLSENVAGCYPDLPGPAELAARIDDLAEDLAAARAEIGARIDAMGARAEALEARAGAVEKSTGLISAEMQKLRAAFNTTKTVADKTFESLAGRIEDIVQRQAQQTFEQAVAEALQGRPIRRTLDEIYDDLAKPVWRFSGRIEGGWVTMTLAYERQISAPVFSPALRFCLTPLFLPAAGADVTVSEMPTVRGYFTLLDERFRSNPAIVRTCQSIDHAALSGRGPAPGSEGAPLLSPSGQYQYPYAENFVQQHYFAAEARHAAGELEPWNGWYYLQVVREASGTGGAAPEIVLRAIIDATIDEEEGYDSPVILPCKVYSAGNGATGGGMLPLDPARQMSDLLSSETPRLDQNETCHSDPS